jgi:hypothetical protein
MTGITKYNLSWNNFTEDEGYILQEAAYTHYRIVMFDLHNNPVKYTTLDAIAA